MRKSCASAYYEAGALRPVRHHEAARVVAAGAARRLDGLGDLAAAELDRALHPAEHARTVHGMRRLELAQRERRALERRALFEGGVDAARVVVDLPHAHRARDDEARRAERVEDAV